MAYQWTLDKIRALNSKEIRALMENARAADNVDIVQLCEIALSEPAANKGVTEKARKATADAFALPPSAVADVARLIASLPSVDGLSNGLERRRIQANPTRTLGELWRLFITCGFSSMENSEEGSRLDVFIKSDGPLFDLAYIVKLGCERDWVLEEIRRYVPRLATNKRNLVIGNYALFAATDGTPQTLLADLCKTGEHLSLFCRLARGEINDRNLSTSAQFSQDLNPKPFPGIGNKQLRNILVNSGLAHNVVPLDLRWQRFFGEMLPINSGVLTRKSRYLAIEDVLRQALLSIAVSRPDIKNLAVLDAIVFQHMSRRGMNGGWSGAGHGNEPLAA